MAPLVPESGNIWPEQAVLAATPTLSDLERNPAAAPGFAPTTVPGERPGRTVLRHSVIAHPTSLAMRLAWPLAIRWLHDACVEDIFDTAVTMAVGDEYKEPEPSSSRGGNNSGAPRPAFSSSKKTKKRGCRIL